MQIQAQLECYCKKCMSCEFLANELIFELHELLRMAQCMCNEESYCYVCVTTMINVLTIRSNKLVIILVNSKY